MSRNKRPWAFSSYERFALAVGVLLLATIACFLASQTIDTRTSLSERMPIALLAYIFLAGGSCALFFLARGDYPSSRMPGWQLGLLLFVPYSALAALLALLPYLSLPLLVFGLAMTLLGAISGVIYHKRQRPWAAWIFAAVWPTLLYAIALRAWTSVLPGISIWLPLLLLAYLLAWLLPMIHPRISLFLFREQTTPQTRVGKLLLAISLALLPTAGSLGAIAGMYLPRHGLRNEAFAILALLSTLVGLALAQSSSHQLWKRSRAKSGI